MKRRLKSLFLLLIVALPWKLKILIYNKIFGHEIDATARIGFSYINVEKLKMGPYARIGHMNAFTGLALLELETHAFIGNLNRANALPRGSNIHFQEVTERFPSLVVGAHTAIVKGHFFDCNSAIVIGHHSLIAGQGCVFFTHGIDIEQNRQKTAPISIGSYCMVTTCCVVTKGAALPDFSILGANSTLHKAFDTPYMLYSGVPAQPVKALNPSSAFFHREKGRVD